MLNKEEIKEIFIKPTPTWEELNKISNYIEQLENDKQELIEILEKANKEDTETVKHYEEMRRNIKKDNIFYKKSYQTSIHKLNAKRVVRESILSILTKGSGEKW